MGLCYPEFEWEILSYRVVAINHQVDERMNDRMRDRVMGAKRGQKPAWAADVDVEPVRTQKDDQTRQMKQVKTQRTQNEVAQSSRTNALLLSGHDQPLKQTQSHSQSRNQLQLHLQLQPQGKKPKVDQMEIDKDHDDGDEESGVEAQEDISDSEWLRRRMRPDAKLKVDGLDPNAKAVVTKTKQRVEERGRKEKQPVDQTDKNPKVRFTTSNIL